MARLKGVVQVLFGLLLSLLGANLAASGSLGTEFWLAFPANFSGNTISVFISAGTNTSGLVEVPGIGFSAPFSVSAGSIINVPITLTAQLESGVGTDFEGIENKGVHITADNPVTVYGLNRRGASTDAYLGLPVDALGLSYRVASYSSTLAGSEMGVVATEDNTTVTITLSDLTSGHSAGVPYNVVLNEGQVYTLVNRTSSGDLTGTLVEADKPVSVISGHTCAFIPDGYSACDHIVEQVLPLSSWGKRFVTYPLATRTRGDIFRVVAHTAGTVFSLNGVPQPPLAAGGHQELTLTAASLIESDQPVMVLQYSPGTSFDSVTSDPFMMLVPPYEQFVSQYVVSTPASGFSMNFLNLVVPASEVGLVTVDGVPVPAGAFSAIGSSGYWGASYAIALGPHSVSSSAPIGVWVYGFDSADSYGYPGGAQTSAVALVDSLTLSPKTASHLVGEQHCVTATALAGVSPVAGVRIDFTRTGAHPGSGFAFTNSAGQAVWCWTGSTLGVDDIVGRLGTLSDTAQATWTFYTPTQTPTFSVSPTRTVSATVSPTPTATPSRTASATLTASPTATPTGTPTLTSTRSVTFTHSPSFTHSPTVTATPTKTPPPLTLSLLPPNPNPAKDTIWLPYRLGTDADVDVKVWTVSGEPVRAWSEGFQPLGVNEAKWDLRNEAGVAVGSGIFIYSVRARSPIGEERREFGKCAISK